MEPEGGTLESRSTMKVCLQKVQPAKGETAVQKRHKRAKNKIVLENFLKKVYNFLKNEHSTIYAGRHT